MALIPSQLKEILVCPLCHGGLIEDEAKNVLRCPKDDIEFPVRDGIPIMLVPEGHFTPEGNEVGHGFTPEPKPVD